MKKLLTSLLCLAMVMSFMPSLAFAADETPSDPNANRTEITESTIALEAGVAYKLTKDVNLNSTLVVKLGKANENGYIPSAQIYLNGHKLTSKSGHTIQNNGKLRIYGDGTVENNNKGSAALYNAPGAEATLYGGTFTGDKWYVIKNLGKLEITPYNDAVVTIDQKDAKSSGIDNGYYGNAVNDCGETASSDSVVELTINGGNFTGGVNAVKNDDYGVLTIKDGTFTNTTGPAIQNWNVTTIEDGTFSVTGAAKAVISNGYLNGTSNKGQLTINGGTFTASENGTGNLFTTGATSGENGKVTIKNGTFTGEFNVQKAYLPEVFAGTFSDTAVLKYLVGNAEIKIVLNKDVNGGITVPAGANVNLDLNGHTINAGTGNGTAAIKNLGTVEISNGTIKRDDNNDPAKDYYVINNEGIMSINEGTVVTNNAADASLVRNDGTLTIFEGKIEQTSFIAVKNDDHGVLNVKGGEIIGGNDTENSKAAILNWKTANISGGTVKGAVVTRAWSDEVVGNTTISSDAKVEGAIKADKYGNATAVPAPTVAIKGGTLDVTEWIVEDEAKVEINVEKAKFIGDNKNAALDFIEGGKDKYEIGEDGKVTEKTPVNPGPDTPNPPVVVPPTGPDTPVTPPTEIEDPDTPLGPLPEEEVIAAVKAMKITASSKAVKGKITVKWKVKGNTDAIDGYRVYKSTKKDKGFKFMGKTKKLSMANKKNLKKGTRYFYKVRAYKVLDSGKVVYSDYSNLANRYAK